MDFMRTSVLGELDVLGEKDRIIIEENSVLKNWLNFSITV